MEKNEFVEQFKKRTKLFSIEIIQLYDRMKKTDSTRVVGKQLLRSATSTAANYRAACIARSRREFYSKMSITCEEADESAFWLEILIESKIVIDDQLVPLLEECTEISKVVSKARKSAGEALKKS